MGTDDGTSMLPGNYNSHAHASLSASDPYTEITLDMFDDSVTLHAVESSEHTLLAKGVKKRTQSLVQSASTRIRQVSEELKRLTSFSKQERIGLVGTKQSTASHALKGLMFINDNDAGGAWPALEKRFDELTEKTGGLLPRSLFGECIGMSDDSKDFAKRLADSLCSRWYITSDSITKAELKDFWELLADKNFDSRLQAFFDMVDKDADGRIVEDEVRELISVSASANGLSNIKNRADEYAALIMEELDPYGIGYIEIEKLEMLMLQEPTHNETRKSYKGIQKQKLINRWYEDMKYFLHDNWKRCWVVALWIGIMVFLFTWKYIEYKRRAVYDVLGPCVCIAKGAAETLKLNMALILLPVCRNTITRLRYKTKLRVIVPLDDNMSFHQVIAVAIAIGVGLHVVSHLTCDFPRLIHATKEEYKPLQQYFGDQPKNYWYFVKEVEGYTGIAMVILMTIAFTLATPWMKRGKLNQPSFAKKLMGFNAFWYSHHLFGIVYVMLIVHGIKLNLVKEWYKKTTWMYLVVPVSVYICERLTRVSRSLKPFRILKVGIHPGDVLSLHLTKPKGFKYKSGQYVFVNCPNVSKFEWRLFPFLSAPSDEDLCLNMGAENQSDWTGQVRTVFREACEPGAMFRSDKIPTFPKVFLDGPYGASAQEYKKYDVVLQVNLGVAASSMISIMKDIMNNIKDKEEKVLALEDSTILPDDISDFKTNRAYFYWVSSQQEAFSWFRSIMNETALMHKHRVIEVHNYCSSVYEVGDARSALITMLQSLNHAKTGVDVLSDSLVKTHFGKPNWPDVFKKIADDNPGCTIGVFCCGPSSGTRELKKLALQCSNASTKFEFHKENF